MTSLLVAVLVGGAVCQVAILITTVYLHRALSHRALTLHPGVRWVCRVATWITTGIRPRQWVAVHRAHHAHTDVPGDPHSPKLEGFTAVQFNNVGLYRRAVRKPGLVDRYARDVPADRWDRLLFDHAFVGLGLGITALCLLLGWRAGLVAAAFHTATYLLLNAAINAVGHTFGSQPGANTAFNNQWLALITGGEGLHNNHHAAPASPRFALHAGEIDPAWWVIRLLRRKGWAELRQPAATSRRAA